MKTLARTISPTVRLVRSDVALVRPSRDPLGDVGRRQPGGGCLRDGGRQRGGRPRLPASTSPPPRSERPGQSCWVRAATSSPSAKPCTCSVVAAPTSSNGQRRVARR